MRRLVTNFLAAFVALAPSAAAGTVANSQKDGAPPAVAPRRTPPRQTSWEGTYKFQEGGGRTAAGTGMAVEHTVVVYRRGGELMADIDAAGFQTSVSLRCDAKAEGDRLSFYFRGYREDNTFEPYREGPLLFSFEKAGGGARPRLLTHWGAYRPALGGGRSGRVYFRKTS